MTPENLRTLSLRTFKATIYLAVAGILIIIALPNPAFADTARLAVKVTAWAGLACLVLALISNLVSLVTGSMAWFKGSRHCAWIIVSLVVVLFPIAIFLSIYI